MEKSPQINELSGTDGLGKPTTASVRGIYAAHPSARHNISPPLDNSVLKIRQSETI